MKYSLQSPVNRIKAVLDNQPVQPVPRGELWLGSELLHRAGLSDTVENHFRLDEQLSQEMVCLPVALEPGDAPDLGYRYFESADLKGVTGLGDRFVAAVVDGPFQALVNRMGLMAVLTAWVRDRQGLVEAYTARQAKTLDLIGECLDHGVHGVVVTDDLAADRGPMISPSDIETLCGPFYKRAIPMIRGATSGAFFHSCGNISQLIPLIKSWGVDGLAAVQHGVNDLDTLRRELGTQLTIMAGIDADLLESDLPSAAALKSFERIVTALAPAGGLILSSCCGLYRGDFLPRIKRLYELADRLSEV